MEVVITRINYEIKKDMYFLFFQYENKERYAVATQSTLKYMRLKNSKFVNFKIGQTLNLFNIPNTQMFKLCGVNYGK